MHVLTDASTLVCAQHVVQLPADVLMYNRRSFLNTFHLRLLVSILSGTLYDKCRDPVMQDTLGGCKTHCRVCQRWTESRPWVPQTWKIGGNMLHIPMIVWGCQTWHFIIVPCHIMRNSILLLPSSCSVKETWLILLGIMQKYMTKLWRKQESSMFWRLGRSALGHYSGRSYCIMDRTIAISVICRSICIPRRGPGPRPAYVWPQAQFLVLFWDWESRREHPRVHVNICTDHFDVVRKDASFLHYKLPEEYNQRWKMLSFDIGKPKKLIRMPTDRNSSSW